jgi:hypothetical protein
MLLLAVAGCGESGVSSGATVSVYVSASLCPEAKRQLARSDGRAGDVRVRVVCAAEAKDRNRLDLATVGANARRAVEDSATVGYIETRGPATRFSQPILEEAGIARISSSSGATTMRRLLQAIEDADTSSLRDSVHDALNET